MIAQSTSSFADASRMKGAQCKTFGKAGLLIEACNLIDQMQISQQNQDLRQGDISTGSVPSLPQRGCHYYLARRYLPVSESFALRSCFGVPSNTTVPPLLPPSGPISTTQSALRMTS